LFVNPEEAGLKAQQYMLRLQAEIYKKTPAGCMLAKNDYLPKEHLVLTPEMVASSLISRKDICNMCGFEGCSNFKNLGPRWLRAAKLLLAYFFLNRNLGGIFNGKDPC
jgi:hypothetical protein